MSRYVMCAWISGTRHIASLKQTHENSSTFCFLYVQEGSSLLVTDNHINGKIYNAASDCCDLVVHANDARSVLSGRNGSLSIHIAGGRSRGLGL